MPNLVRTFRKMRCFSQDVLAIKAGLSQAEVSKIERDLLPMVSPARKEKLARALGTDPDMLFLDDKDAG